jgi:hypothetical protein
MPDERAYTDGYAEQVVAVLVGVQSPFIIHRMGRSITLTLRQSTDLPKARSYFLCSAEGE